MRIFKLNKESCAVPGMGMMTETAIENIGFFNSIEAIDKFVSENFTRVPTEHEMKSDLIELDVVSFPVNEIGKGEKEKHFEGRYRGNNWKT